MNKWIFALATMLPMVSSASFMDRLSGGYGNASSQGLHHVAFIYKDKETGKYLMKFEGGCTAEAKVNQDSIEGVCTDVSESGLIVYYSGIAFIESDETQLYWKMTADKNNIVGFKGMTKAEKLY